MAVILWKDIRRYTDMLKSRSASFNEVFLSVDAFRCPIINAQGMPKLPAGNVLLVVPGITTDFGGIYPLYSLGWSPLTSIIFVLPVMVTLAPITASSPTWTPSTKMARDPINAWSSTTTGCAWSGSRTPPIPTPPLKWTCCPIWAQEPTAVSYTHLTLPTK